MALVQCIECKREISDRAPACPHCGMPYAPEVPKKPAVTPVAPAAKAVRPTGPEVIHVKHDDRSGFSKGIERGMEDVGSHAAKGLLWVAFIVVGVLFLGAVFAVRSSVVCPDCNGKGSSYGLFNCQACNGTGYRK